MRAAILLSITMAGRFATLVRGGRPDRLKRVGVNRRGDVAGYN
jgi:hypothetical protein